MQAINNNFTHYYIKTYTVMRDICTITKGCYRDFAEQIAQEIGRSNYLNGVFYSDSPKGRHRLEVSLIVYREAKGGRIIDIGDIWWDSYTIIEQEDGEPKLMINDFDFARLREELV